MARKRITTGIDIGTSSVKAVIAEYQDGETMPLVLGTGIAESKGLRHGYVVNAKEVSESIRVAVAQAEKTSGVKIKRTFLAIGGISLEASVSSGSTFVGRADKEVTISDVERATQAAEENFKKSPNKQIIHSIPIAFKLDDEEMMGLKAVGMKGLRLEAKVLFITCLNQHLKEFLEAAEMANIEVEDIMASPIAASFVTITKRQKTAGCILANIGAETLSIAVFENNIPISLQVFPIGGGDITNDIALGLKIPIEEAEQLKLGRVLNHYPKKKLEDIVEARLSDIFELIEAHLKKIAKSGLLAGGIVITGGSSAIPIIEELAKTSLKIPSKIAIPDFAKNTKQQIKDNKFSVAYGLCIMGLSDDGNDSDSVIKMSRHAKNNILSWLKQFLP